MVNHIKPAKIPADCGIEMGRTYVYTKDLPKGCKGARYKAHRLVMDVPSYQWKVLMEALDGIDAGLWFCCTPANFIMRYEPVHPEPVAEKVVSFGTTSIG